MNITKISPVGFKGKIIDAHAHVGKHEGVTYGKEDLDVFVKSALTNEDIVEKMLISDLDVLHGIKGEYEGNKAALELFKNNKNYAILASCNPRYGNIENIKKLFKEYPNAFIGLKFHPAIQNLELADKRYEEYMAFASKNDLPCLFHSQVEIIEGGKINPNLKHISDPEKIYSLAKKYKKTPVILAHLGAGWRDSHDKAIDVLVESVKKGDANLYADVSWVDIDDAQTHIVKAIKRLKGIGDNDWKYGDQSYRLMFGTDAPISRFKEKNAQNIYSDFVERIKSAIRNDSDLGADAERIIDDLFYNNAEKLYLSKKTKVNFLTKYKTGLIFGGLVATGILGYELFKKIKNSNLKYKKIPTL